MHTVPDVRLLLHEIIDTGTGDVLVRLAARRDRRRHGARGAGGGLQPGPPRRPPSRRGRHDCPHRAPVACVTARPGAAGGAARALGCGASHRLNPSLTCTDRRYLRPMADSPNVPTPAAQAPRPERDRPWVMRTYAGHSSASASNELYRRNLAKGQTGLSVAFDLPTQTGYDPDHPLARGEVGKVGVPISHLGDLRALFDAHPAGPDEHLDDHQRDGDVAARPLPGGGRGAGEGGGDDPAAAVRALAGTTQNDIIKEYLSRGTYVFPPGPSLRLITDMVAYTVAEMPSGTPSTSAATTSRRPGPPRSRRSPTRCAPRSPCSTRSATPGRCRRSGSARSSPGSPSSSTPACASSRRCARCAPSSSSGTRSPATGTACRTRSSAGSATACRSTRSA